jgi:large subunit ribosomal protein L23
MTNTQTKFLAMLLAIKYPLITEKSTEKKEKYNIYTFIVDKKLTKVDIRTIFEKLFNIKIQSINTLIFLKQTKNKRQTKYSKYKKVYLKLEKEQEIPNIF